MATVIEKGLTKNEIVGQLLRSPHEGKIDPKKKLTDFEKLSKYIQPGQQAMLQEPEFFSHMLTWNRIKGQVRDTKVALPILALSTDISEFRENAMANLATLDPRNLLRAWEFAKEGRLRGRRGAMKPLVRRYLATLEKNMGKWERTFVQHRDTIKRLYGLSVFKASPRAGAMLRGEYAVGSMLDVVRNLKDMSAVEAAGQITSRGIPFLVARGALGARLKETDVLMALIERMSPTELVTNMKWLEKLGVKDVPELRAALEKSLTKASKSSANLLKTTVAAEAMADETEEENPIVQKLKGLQERQLQKQVGIEGDWLVLCDKSGSMTQAIEVARQVAGFLTKMVRGRVQMVFFDTSPRAIDVSGKPYDEIVKATKNITANGGTSIGCGLRWAIDAKMQFGGIAVVSDGGENTPPWFVDEYQKYCKVFDCEPTLYLFHVDGESDAFSKMVRDRGLDMQRFDLSQGMDYVALPGLCATMRTSRYSLIDEIMAVDLLTLDGVLGPGKE